MKKLIETCLWSFLLLAVAVLPRTAFGNAGVSLYGSDTQATGSLSATGQTQNFPLNAQCTVGVDISGTWSGSILVKLSANANSVGLATANYGVTTSVVLTTGVIANAITANGQYQINTGGMAGIQFSATSIVSGTAIIAINASSAGCSTVMSDNPLSIAPTKQTPSAPSGALTLTSGGTAQTLFNAGEITNGCTIQNPSTATEKMHVNLFTTAVNTDGGTSIELGIGASMACGPLTTAVSWIAATTGHAINAIKW